MHVLSPSPILTSLYSLSISALGSPSLSHIKCTSFFLYFPKICCSLQHSTPQPTVLVTKIYLFLYLYILLYIYLYLFYIYIYLYISISIYSIYSIYSVVLFLTVHFLISFSYNLFLHFPFYVPHLLHFFLTSSNLPHNSLPSLLFNVTSDFILFSFKHYSIKLLPLPVLFSNFMALIILVSILISNKLC